MEILNHISYSYKSCYDVCPFKCYRQYHLKELSFLISINQEKKNYYLSYGTVVHSIMQMAVDLQILDFDKIFKLGRKISQRELSKFVVEGVPNEFWLDDLKRDITNGLNLLKSIDILSKEHGTEEYFETFLDLEDEKTRERHSQKVIGIIDLWYREDDDIVILDYKTGKPKSQRKVDEMEQLTFYTWLVDDNKQKFSWAVDEIIPAVFYFTNDKFVKSRFRDDDEIEELINSVGKIIENEDFTVKDNPPAFICSSCFGNYKCKYYASRR
jgi:hypothetical protein